MAKEFALSRLTGVILFFLFIILTGLLARFMPEKEDWAVMELVDTKAVRGGVATSSGSGKPLSKVSLSQQGCIALGNVPYIPCLMFPIGIDHPTTSLQIYTRFNSGIGGC